MSCDVQLDNHPAIPTCFECVPYQSVCCLCFDQRLIHCEAMHGTLVSSAHLARIAPVSPRLHVRKQKTARSGRRPADVPRADAFNNMINQLSEVVTNSPVNNLKKGIAKVQAGAYDEAATRAKVDAYLNDNAVSALHSQYALAGCVCFSTLCVSKSC